MKEKSRLWWAWLWLTNRREYAFMWLTEPLRREIRQRVRQHRPTKQVYKEIRGLRDIFTRVV